METSGKLLMATEMIIQSLSARSFLFQRIYKLTALDLPIANANFISNTIHSWGSKKKYFGFFASNCQNIVNIVHKSILP